MTEPLLGNGQEPVRWWEVVLGVMAPIIGFAALGVLISLLGGCIYKGAKVTEGTDLAVGINVPVSEGTLQFQLLNYLSGFRLGIAEDSLLTVDYAVAESNDYFGVVHTRTHKTAKVRVEPLSVDENANNIEEDSLAR